MTKINVRAIFTEAPLGTSPSNENLYQDFIASKAPTLEDAEEEIAALPQDADKGMTVFGRDEGGNPIFWNYQIRGFFKDSCSMLSRVGGKDENGKKRKVNESSKMTAFKKNVDGLIFVQPRKIPIRMMGEMSTCQRPLRAATAQGERVTLAMSEEAPKNSVIEFTVICLADDHAAAVREWLNYGFLRGLGQWRNSGKGTFVWEELDDDGNVIGGNASLTEEARLMLVA